MRYWKRVLYSSLFAGVSLSGFSFGEEYNDTWSFDLQTNEWEELSPGGEPPDPTHGWRAYYDPVNQRMVTNAGGVSQLSLEKGQETWSPMNRPENRALGLNYSHERNTVYRPRITGVEFWVLSDDSVGTDPVEDWDWTGLVGSHAVDDERNRLVDFGRGRLVTYDWNETDFNYVAKRLPLQGDVPLTVDFHEAKVDAEADKMIIFGGNAGDGHIYPDYEGETFELNLETDTWARVDPDSEPSPRGQYATAWDATNRQMYLFGGLYRTSFDFATVETYNDLWVYDSATQSWQEIFASGRLPESRRQPSMVFDEENRRLILFGGEGFGRTTPVRARITIPAGGRRVGGNRVTVAAELTRGTPEATKSILFQYRQPSKTGSWADIAPANVNHTNPDATNPYFVHWDVMSLPNGPVDIRAVAESNGGLQDRNPEYKTVTLDNTNPDSSEVIDGDAVLVTYRTSAGFGDAGVGEENADVTGVLRVRYGPGTTTADNTLSLQFTESGFFAGSEEALTRIEAKADLQNGELNGPLSVIFTYPDANNDGVVDGTNVDVESLLILGRGPDGTIFTLDDVKVESDRKQVTGLSMKSGHFALAGKGEVRSDVFLFR